MKFYLWLASLILAAALQAPLSACPACSPLPSSIQEQVEQSLAAVVAEPLGDGRYQVVETLKGAVEGGKIIRAKASPAQGKVLLVTMTSPSGPFWTGQAASVNPEAIAFLKSSLKLPPRLEPGSRTSRLNFALPYLGHSNRQLADSAYSEFVDAPYAEVARFAPLLGRGRLRKHLANPQTPQAHRSLFFLMLGVCGQKSDLDLVEPSLKKALKGRPPEFLSAMLTCYLQLKGSSGLEWVDRSFLKADPERKGATLAALRILLDETKIIPRARLLGLFRAQLSDLTVAGVVIQDLAAWKDWGALPQITQLAKRPTQHYWVRITAVRYLRTCPLPEAKTALETLDPQLLKQAPTPFQPRPPQ